MSRYSDDGEERVRWYRRRRTWMLVLLAVLVAVVVPVAVTVVKNNEWKNRYPDYKKVTYALSDTCGCSNLLRRFEKGPEFLTGCLA